MGNDAQSFFLSQLTVGKSKYIAILWYGLPYYAASCISAAIRAFPDHRIVVIATNVGVPYKDIDIACGAPVMWIDSMADLKWSDLGLDIPDVCVITSWNHRAYSALSIEAKKNKNAVVVSMVDNYFHGTLKQWAGALYFRLRLRSLFDFMWVPGRRGRRFMRFLGMPDSRILEGLYSASPAVFHNSGAGVNRDKVVFVGQFIYRKGVDKILDFLNTNAGASWRNRIRMIGHGPLTEGLLAAGMRLEPFMQAEELATAYRGARALLLPSQMDHWGVVVHEAALCGCLILATKQCGAVDDLVVHEVNGYIMRESSSVEIARALEWLDGLSAEQMSEGSRVSLSKAADFSPRRWAETLGRITDTVAV